MKENIEKLVKKVESIERSIQSIDKTLIKQHYSLTEHIKRTELLEEEMRPVKKHVNMVQGAGAFIALLALIATIYLSLK